MRYPGVRACLASTLLAVGLFASAAPAGNVYYVSPSGVNGTDGSQANPWRTLQYAADRLAAGDTVHVLAGTYAGFVQYTSGTAVNRIAWQAEPNVTVNQTGSPTWNAGLNLEGADYVTIEGFNVTAVPQAGIRSVNGDGVIIRNNRCDANGTWGILTGHDNDLLIENNVCSRSTSQHGIYVSNSGDRPTIRGNTCWGNSQCGIHMNGDLSSQPGDGIISNALVEANICYNNGSGGGGGINMDGVQDSTIRNNLLYGNHASGITMYRGDGAEGPKGNTVVNNTVVQAADGRWCLLVNAGLAGNNVRNNILYNAHAWKGSITAGASSLGGLSSDYNVVMDRFSADGESSVITVAQWRSQTGQDVHSIIATPAQLFANPAGNDYRLRPDSPAVNAGTAAFAPGQDLLGRPRPAEGLFDIGAYEFLVGGDATLDGRVNVDDLGALASHYDTAGAIWQQGDFTGDGQVNVDDLGVLASNYDWSRTSPLPEPASLAILALAAIVLPRRRRQ